MPNPRQLSAVISIQRYPHYQQREKSTLAQPTISKTDNMHTNLQNREKQKRHRPISMRLGE